MILTWHCGCICFYELWSIFKKLTKDKTNIQSKKQKTKEYLEQLKGPRF